jgi:hypothetical protein
MRVQKSLLVIFGAGASYDSSSDIRPPPKGKLTKTIEDFRLPLANQLFERRDHFDDAVREYHVTPVITRLRYLKQSSLEEQLRALQKEGEVDPIRLRQLAGIRFYLRKIISMCEEEWIAGTRGNTNYVALVEQLRHSKQLGMVESVLLATFNYDTLLERAFAPIIGKTFSKFQDYMSTESFQIFKLHGSTNWMRRVYVHADRFPTPEDALEKLIRGAEDIEVMLGDDAYRMPFDWTSYAAGEELAYPAIAIPVEEGKTFECLDTHRQHLEGRLPAVTHVLCIGWRGMEKHFLDLAIQRIPAQVQVLIVSGSQAGAEEICKRLADTGFRGTFHAFDGGFSQLVQSDRVETFLRQ